MGYKYEVLMWVKDDNANCFNDIQAYAGDSLFSAYKAMRKAKKKSGCVTFKWR